MLKSLLKLLPTTIGKGEARVAISDASVPDGYHAPEQAAKLLATPQRRQWLQTLWDYSSLPKDLYQQYYLQPLEHCVTLMQMFPATESGHHAYLGGMVDHLLETVAYAARLSKNYLLPIGAQPEEQASQSTAWNAVIVYAAMLQSLDRLCHIEVELENGQCWMPLIAMPDEPYRFRFKPSVDAIQVQSLGAMLAWKVIPDEVLIWLSTWPEALKTLSLYLTGFRSESGIVNAIVSDAIRTSVGEPVLPAEQIVQPTSDLRSITPSALLPMSHTPSSTILSAGITSAAGGAGNENIKLVSALDGDFPCEMDVISTDATSELLVVMGYGDAEKKSNIASEVQETVLNLGSFFSDWLKKILLEQSTVVNESESQVYIIAGYVFVRTPTIFYLFISENKLALAEQHCDWRTVQKQFEKLKLHKRQTDGTNVYRCRDKEGNKSFNGYLIPAAKIYGVVSPPADSSLLIVK
ncbi:MULTISPECIES: TraI domain-containing protein [Serratia]|jgi:integrating conjugative element relaxase (TIGR03760 family)|uniref:TraI domain-containing protein n=1 Tax=Serratia TaxID=613 RepID=UPI002AC406EB|nr:TraI domain-containing protein [Yersinia enterocolitica]HEN3244190.1 TraI domain-containing protein [Yersinia enterocolitica]HEN3450903.1 TraI domain-containing protein [Yersinia enterocolitica]HEN5458051.1 TraI domain-containing protein [Yersinia enterocolitica]